jgi:hypothetical protein
MDCAATVNLRADQAIFTSVRSVMNEGYRLIAVSPGIRADERTEITRRSPSHGGLCDETPSGAGFSSYRLSTGRFCIASSRYAGVEHTGRGGNRVYTHLVVVDREGFLQCKFNPLAVYAALQRAIGTEPVLNPPARFEALSFPVPEPALPALFQIEHVCHLLSCAFVAGQPLVVTGISNPLETFHGLLAALPLSNRETLSVAIGLKYCVSRHMILNFVDHDPGDLQRLIRGHGIGFFDGSVPVPKDSWPPTGWLALVQRWLKEGRLTDIRRIAEALPEKTKPGEVDRIALICTDIDQAKLAHESLLERLAVRYAAFQPTTEAEAAFVRMVKAAIKSRAAAIRQSKTAGDSSSLPAESLI